MRSIDRDIEEVKKYNPEVAARIQKYVKNHSYGLVFEHNLPEAIRLYTKKPGKGDVVNILPERGKEETDENKISWVVKSIDDNNAVIVNDSGERTISVDDIVTVVSYKDVIYPGLKVVDKVENGNPEDPYHMVINSENYHALEMLAYAYAGKVDCIYIDPPYNTGARDWKYNNDYVGQEDQYRHSKWLAFMERRLKLAKQLLNPDDSVLIVTIDEKEYLRLGMLLEQMFPEARIQMISSVINPNGSMRKNAFSRTDEYIYIVMFGGSSPHPISLSEDWMGKVKNTIKDKIHWMSLRRTGTGRYRKDRPNLFYPIYISNDGKKIVDIGESISLEVDRHSIPDREGCVTIWPLMPDGTECRWQMGQDTLRDFMNKHCVQIGKFNSDKTAINYLNKSEQKKIIDNKIEILGYREDGSLITDAKLNEASFVPGTQWWISAHDANRNGSKLIQDFIPDRKFPFPKSLYAVEDVMRFFVADKPDALIVDFFAGSGTTLHATMLLNHLDGGHRRCICVTNNEVGENAEKEFVKKGLRPSDEEWQKYGIANYITWERVKAAITGINTQGEPIKGDYKFTEEFPMSDGFKENAVFCELTYESEWPIRLDRAFNAIAPILWMQAGCKGKIIEKIGKAYRYTDNYAVLFDFKQASGFVKTVKDHPSIKTAYVVTDDQRRYSNICKRLAGIGVEVHRLYESYLKTFEIYGEGYYD